MKTRTTIGRKLLASFISVSIITLLLGAAGFYGISKGGQAIAEIGTVRLPGVQSLLVMSEALTATGSAENMLLSRNIDAKTREANHAAIDTALGRADAARARFEPLPKADDEMDIWNAFVPAWDAWRKDHDTYITLCHEFEALGIADPTALQRNLFEVRGTLWKTVASLNKLVKDGVPLEDTDKVNTLLAENVTDWTQSLGASSAAVTKVMEELQPVNAAMMESLRGIQESMSRNDTVPALEQYQQEFLPNAMKAIEAMRPIRGEVLKAEEAYARMAEQALVANAASFATVQGQLSRLVEINAAATDTAVDLSSEQGAWLKGLSIAAMIGGVVSALALGWLISRGINNTLRQLAASLKLGSDATAAAAGQVAQSSQAMAEGASTQASSLEETSASVEELTSMTKQNADNAGLAVNLMIQAKQTVDGMARATEEMSAAISQIKASADQTARIVKTIDEIAFQTNLLALNAAVEAARAGDAGKGFAVVAEEVRNLAQRSAEAAKNTASMIEESVRNADNGVHVAGRVGSALRETVENAGRVSQLVNEIAVASKEQSQGLSQVNTAISQIDHVTQTNAASSEEAAAAAEELNAQADQLNQLVKELLSMVGGSNAMQSQDGHLGIRAKSLARKRAGLPSPGRTHTVVNPEHVVMLEAGDMPDS
ncbi:MAG: MCP four helix bundle domain-containing protein [Candidatus Hydrogenedentes bacterium]|nr:MCP four helix bundle domain-containing protein [Candidatus Hydrogenedentota bacterium]